MSCLGGCEGEEGLESSISEKLSFSVLAAVAAFVPNEPGSVKDDAMAEVEVVVAVAVAVGVVAVAESLGGSCWEEGFLDTALKSEDDG